MPPVDFDEDDISGVIEEAELASGGRQPQFSRVEEAKSLDDQMSEVEKRLEMAQYYRLVLNDTIFNDPPNVEVADRVEGEIREFVRGRMSLLVGVSAEKKAEVAFPFSAEEVLALRTIAQPEVVSALKALAAKVLKKPEILNVKPRPEQAVEKPKVAREPTLKKIVRPPAAQPTQTQRQSMSPASSEKGPQKRVLKKVQREDGSTGLVDVTPPAQPVGIKPFPTPIGRAAIEASAAQTARQQAMVAVANLDKQFSSK